MAKLRTLKFWQTREAQFVWQVQLYGDNLPRKAYLIADANQSKRGVTLSTQKPGQIHQQGPAALLVRKYAKQALVPSIWQTTDGNIWLPMFTDKHQQRPSHYVQLSNDRPPVLSFIEADTPVSLVRVSSQGVYTKKSMDIAVADFSQATDLLPAVCEHLTGATKADQTQDRDICDDERKDAIQKIRRRLKTLRKSLAKQNQHVASAEETQRLEQEARWLQSFGYLVKNGDFELVLRPEHTGQETALTVNLDPEKSLGQNIEEKFVQAKKAAKSSILGRNQLQKIEQDILSMERAIACLKDENQKIDVERLLANLGIKRKTVFSIKAGRQEEAKPFRVFCVDQTNILVGKGAAENDIITKKAKANDFWLHAVGVTGSHVIVEGHKFRREELPEHIFLAAAILALHYSKLKSDLGGEVYYTRRSNIRKQKGMPVGLWNVEHSKAVHVRYTQEQLEDVMKALKS